MKPENITYNLIKRGEAISLESDRAIDAKKDEILAEIDSKSIVNIKPFYKKYKTSRAVFNRAIVRWGRDLEKTRADICHMVSINRTTTGRVRLSDSDFNALVPGIIKRLSKAKPDRLVDICDELNIGTARFHKRSKEIGFNSRRLVVKAKTRRLKQTCRIDPVFSSPSPKSLLCNKWV